MTDQFKLALIALGGALIGGLVSGFYQHLRDWFTRPRLSVGYTKDDAHFVHFVGYRPDVGDISAIYVRVRVRNSGRRVAKGCRVFLTRLNEVHHSGATPTALYDTLVLSWPGGKDHGPRDIYQGVDFYADIVRVSKSTPGWFFCVKEMYGSYKDLANYRGTYRLQIVVTAENAKPAQCEVDVTYDGDWHNFRAVSVA